MNENMEQKKTAYLTHELRAPLASIQCALALIAESTANSLTPSSRRFLELAQLNTQRLKYLIDDLLDLSKIQAGSMRMFPKPCDPAALAKEAVALLLPWAEKQKISLTAETIPGLPPIEADPRRVVQVMTNLISNAIKFTRAGGSVVVSVALGQREDAGYVMFSIRDTGCGIESKDITRLFRFFSQVGNADSQVEGTGLGLALSRSLVEIMGGAIRVVSQPGQGSTFSFTMPMYLARPDHEPTAIIESKAGQS